jgi:hypothetical protein
LGASLKVAGISFGMLIVGMVAEVPANNWPGVAMAAAMAPAPAGVMRKFRREVRGSDFESVFSFMELLL